MHRQLAAREQAAERFAEQVIAAQEAERGRLARDIHDGIMQRLVGLTYHLDAATGAVSEASPFGAEQLAIARDLADLTLDEGRATIAGLRPPVLDDLGLADGLASLARSVAQLDVQVDVADCDLSEHTQTALYRIAQESLQNVVKHASATKATSGCGATPSMRCCGSPTTAAVSSAPPSAGRRTARTARGRGRPGRRPARTARAGTARARRRAAWATWAPGPVGGIGDRPGAESSYGLRAMAERAELMGGRLEVTSRPGLGTTVTAVIPLSRKPSPGPA